MSTHSTTDTLVRMANQIGKFFAIQGEERAVTGIADHIRRFWEPRMKSGIYAHIEEGGKGLDPLVLKALQKLKVTAEEAAAKKAAQVPADTPPPVATAKAKAKTGTARAGNGKRGKATAE